MRVTASEIKTSNDIRYYIGFRVMSWKKWIGAHLKKYIFKVLLSF